MPIAKSLSKVQKKVSGSSGAVHPKGRKFKQLTRASLRQEKLAKDKTKRNNTKEAQLVSIRFFKEAVQLDDKLSYTVDEIKEMIDAFIRRDEDELKRLEQDRRPGRPKSSRHDMLQLKYEYDLAAYKSGYNVPDLTSELVVKSLRAWSGTHGGLNVIPMIRIAQGSNAPATVEDVME